MSAPALSFGGLSLRGASRAGDQTWFRIDPPGLALDVGRGAGPLVGARWVFLSHTHLDHASGLPWVLTQRKFQGLGPTTVLCPAASEKDLAQFVEAAGRLEGEELEARIVPLEPGDSFELENKLRLEVFEAAHTAPALGCHLIRRQSRLLPELSAKTSDEVAELKRNGATVAETSDRLLLSYCGDTSAAIFETEPRLFKARVLLAECTFLGSETRELGARFGHLHLEDFAAVAHRFENEALVLYHLSKRHRPADLEKAVRETLPTVADRIHFLLADSEPRRVDV